MWRPKPIQNLILSELVHSDLNEYMSDNNSVFIYLRSILYTKGTPMYST